MNENIPSEWRESSSLEPEVKIAIEAECERAVAARSTVGALVYFLVIVVVALTTRYSSDHPFILSTVGCLVLITGIVRITAGRRLLSQVPVITARIRWLFLGSIYATVTIWGAFCAATVVLYRRDWSAMFILLNTAALTAGASSSLAPNLTLARRCLVLMMAPTVVCSFLLRDTGYAAFGAMTSAYLGFLLVQTRSNWWAFWSSSVAAERERIRGSAERRRAEAERATLVAAIEQAAEEILITDTEGNIRYCNPAFERVTGYSRDEVIGRNPRLLKSDRHESDYYGAVWGTILQGKVWSGHFTNRKKDGSLYETEGTIAPIHDDSAKLTGFVSAWHDVTERNRLESDLRHAQKMESIGRLAGGVAHDFNNLLTVITGFSGLLDHELEKTDWRRDYVKEIRVAGERAASLTKQLLAFGRKQVIRPVPLYLNRLLEEMHEMIQRLVGEDIRVEIRPGPDLAVILADPDQISQILLNLAANSRDAMPNGGRIVIRTQNVAGPGQDVAEPQVSRPMSVLLAFTDTGLGIPEENREHLFEPFFTTKERGHGTGLGLSSVYGIVHQSNGWIDVQSEPQKGTTFNVHLPAISRAVQNEGLPEPAFETPRRSSGTVLVVEDQDEVRRLLKAVLEADGFYVLEAPGGHAALSLVRSYPEAIDLLVTDVIMPVMTGKQVFDSVAILRPELKVLYISGYSGEVLADRGILDASVEYLQKPFTPASLSARVRELLSLGTKGLPHRELVDTPRATRPALP